jgi:hypothetical protein
MGLRENKFMIEPTSFSIQKERLTAKLPVELIERVRNAVYWTPGLTLARLAAIALTKYLDDIETERGAPFPPRQSELKAGRPIKM